MPRGEYRKTELYYAEEIRTNEDHLVDDEDIFIHSEDFKNLMNKIEEETKEIINLLEEYDTKEAMEKLRELKKKLY